MRQTEFSKLGRGPCNVLRLLFANYSSSSWLTNNTHKYRSPPALRRTLSACSKNSWTFAPDLCWQIGHALASQPCTYTCTLTRHVRAQGPRHMSVKVQSQLPVYIPYIHVYVHIPWQFAACLTFRCTCTCTCIRESCLLHYFYKPFVSQFLKVKIVCCICLLRAMVIRLKEWTVVVHALKSLNGQ